MNRRSIDLNCDMGEGMPGDALIMPLISSANIACGYHAGDAATLRHTMELAAQHQVAVGAHVSFADPENFGRTEMHLPADTIYQLVLEQLVFINTIAASLNMELYHVKPHGALYNQSAKDPVVAQAIAQAVSDFDTRLILFGLSGSVSISEAQALGLRTASEVFADRAYREDGSLVPRSQPAALIRDARAAAQQALQLVRERTVSTLTGKTIPVTADTLCIHGDGEQAVLFARAIHSTLKQHDIEIKAV